MSEKIYTTVFFSSCLWAATYDDTPEEISLNLQQSHGDIMHLFRDSLARKYFLEKLTENGWVCFSYSRFTHNGEELAADTVRVVSVYAGLKKESK